MIRKATSRDLKEIATLFRKIFSEAPYNEKWSNKSSNKKIREYRMSGDILVAIDNKNIVGFIVYTEILWDTFYLFFINELAVKKSHRNKGIATQLLQAVENEAKKRGIPKIELIVNKTAIALHLYKKLGYRESKHIEMVKIL